MRIVFIAAQFRTRSGPDALVTVIDNTSERTPIFIILIILLVALVVIVIDLAHYHLNQPGAGPSSFRIGAVTTAVITSVIGAAVLFYYLNTA